MYRRIVTLLLYVLLNAPALGAPPTEVVIDLGLNDNTPNVYLMVNGAVFRSYPVAVPRHTPRCLYRRDVSGTITAINPMATWWPTAKMLKHARARGKPLKKAYGPHDPKNAIGHRKFRIAWDNACFDPTVRLHGTNQPRYVRKRARVSHGCFRMLNKDWNDLAHLIPIGTPVVVTGYFDP